MTTLNGMLETGVRALKAYQTALQVTAHNISNTNTEGYTRQRANFATMNPFDATPGQIGTGVKVIDIVRMRMSTYDATVRLQQNQLGMWEKVGKTTQALQRMMGDATNGSIGVALTNFWNGWHELATAPEEVSTRQALVDTAVILADALRDAVSQLNRLASGTDLDFVQDVNEANSLIMEIANLNEQIRRAELGGNNANDLRDRRDLAVEKLADMTNLEVEETETGLLLTVGGDTVVDGVDYYLFEAVDDGDGHLTVQFEGGGALFFDAGRFQGYRDSYQLIDETLETINDLAAVLIEEVNAIHNTGFTLLGALGDDFFEGTDATSIQVNSDIVADARLVAGSGSGAPGNGDTALEIAQLAMSKIAPGGDAQFSLNEYFGNLVVNLGSRARQATQRTDDYNASLEFVKDQRRFISGVNMDEEVSNLLAFQHGYAAASRVITAVDDMMDRVINRTGRVGL